MIKDIGAINLSTLKLDALQEKILWQFLHSIHLTNTINSVSNLEKGTPFDVEVDQQKYRFTLSHSLLCRPSNKYKSELRFDIVAEEELGHGKDGYAKNILATIALQPDKTIRFKTNIERVVKILEKSPDESDQEFEQRVKHESVVGQKLPHLKTKPAFFAKVKDNGIKNGYLIMHKCVGKTLARILVEDRQGERRLSFEDRVLLTIVLLEAIKEQLHDKDIVHRDLTENNVILDLMKMPPKALTIDVAFAQMKTEIEEQEWLYGCQEDIRYISAFCFQQIWEINDYDLLDDEQVDLVTKIDGLLWELDVESLDKTIRQILEIPKIKELLSEKAASLYAKFFNKNQPVDERPLSNAECALR